MQFAGAVIQGAHPFAGSLLEGAYSRPMLLSEIFGPDLLIVLVIIVVLIALLGCSIWAIIDVSSHSKQAFYSAGSSKVAWIVVISIFTVFYGFGSLIAIYYLVRVRPKVLRVEEV
jgi:hypothetical protein